MVRPTHVPPSTPKKHGQPRVAGKSINPSAAARAELAKQRRAKLNQMPTNGVSSRVIRVLGLQAGIGTFTKEGKQALREIMHEDAQAVLRLANEQARYAHKRTVTGDMVLHAYETLSGRKMYIGYGDQEQSSRGVHAVMVKILKAGRSKKKKNKAPEEAAVPDADMM